MILIRIWDVNGAGWRLRAKNVTDYSAPPKASVEWTAIDEWRPPAVTIVGPSGYGHYREK